MYFKYGRALDNIGARLQLPHTKKNALSILAMVDGFHKRPTSYHTPIHFYGFATIPYDKAKMLLRCYLKARSPRYGGGAVKPNSKYAPALVKALSGVGAQSRKSATRLVFCSSQIHVRLETHLENMARKMYTPTVFLRMYNKPAMKLALNTLKTLALVSDEEASPRFGISEVPSISTYTEEMAICELNAHTHHRPP